MSLTASNTALHPDDTIVAVSSAQGPGKRAIVRISGPHTLAAINAVFSAREREGLPARLPHRLVPGRIQLSGVFSPVPATLYFFAGPKTYTGQDLAELHLVGSPPLVERLVTDLLKAGARPATPGEFTLRAFLAGKKDLPQAEAVNAVIEADTDADLQLALTQLAGGIVQPLHALREDLLNLLADLEAALDFSDEDIEFVGKLETVSRIDSARDLLGDVLQQLDKRTVSGRAVRIALVGLPNAGKSSLFNALADSDAIVSPTPGTTRDYLTRPITLGDIAAELIDTAGWQSAEDTIAEQAQWLCREQAGQADVILWCVETGSSFSLSDETRLTESEAKLIRVRTKYDLASQESRVRSRESGDRSQESGNRLVIPVSTVTKEGINSLRLALSETVTSVVRSPLAPSQSRCRHHVASSLEELTRAGDHVANGDPLELTAAALRIAIDQLGEMTGAVYTNDLLDRIFSRFCIGK
jgi:tRNA modification GTPase